MAAPKTSLMLAIDGYHAPSRMRSYRRAELRDDIHFLLLIVSGDLEAEREAVLITGRTVSTVRKAAEFFVEQVLFIPEADAYRILGAHPSMSSHELRKNMALILRWLHPDVNKNEQQRDYSRRVTAAWNQLKTPALRLAYNEMAKQSLSAGQGFAVGHGKRNRVTHVNLSRGRDVMKSALDTYPKPTQIDARRPFSFFSLFAFVWRAK